SEDDLREAAIEVYHAAIKEREKEEAEYEVEKPSNEELNQQYLDALDEAIDWTACDEVDKYCERIGISLESRTEPYRKIGIEFLKAQIAAGYDAYLPLPNGRTLRGYDQHLPPPPKIEPPIPVEPKPITAPPPPKKSAETFAEAAAIYLKNELR